MIYNALLILNILKLDQWLEYSLNWNFIYIFTGTKNLI